MTKSYLDPFTALGLTPSATPIEIKNAYFALVRAHPPEREPETFKVIRAAYEQLRDPQKRIEVEMSLLQPWPEPARKRRPPQLDLTLHPEDVLAAARALTDLERRDWREHYAKIKL